MNPELHSWIFGLQRACENFSAGGAKVCSGREKILQRPPQTCLFFCDITTNARKTNSSYSFHECKDTTFFGKMQEF